MRLTTVLLTALLVATTLLFTGCADGPRDITIGAEECAHCRMLVSEERFAAQLRTDRGQTYVFDSIECLADFIRVGRTVTEEQVRGQWVTDFTVPGRWLAVEEASFLQSEELRSPMGLNLSAYATEAEAHAHRTQYGGEVMTWSEVTELVATIRVGGVSHAH
jgi:copper chaperone NosL